MKKFLSVLVAIVLLCTMLPCAFAEEDKKEMVYVIADANGVAGSISVSEHLYNRDGSETLTDYSRLNNIENIGGDETFENQDGVLIWDANGSDIRYDGTSTEPLPAGVSIRYTLDGTEISASELAGKSGHLVMDIEYTANYYEEHTLNGETVSLPLPFLMATVMLADDETFSNLSVTNGRVVNIGDRTLVICYGLPGLEEALNLKEYSERAEEDKEELEDSDFDFDFDWDIDFDTDIPTTAQISADVTDFSFDGTYTLATASVFNDLDSDGDLTLTFDTASLSEKITDAMTQLTDGAQQLYDGTSELKDGLEEIDSNSAALVDGAKQIVDAIMETANEGLEEKKADFAKLNITLNPLTADNYASEIERLETELLANVEDYVLEQADKTLTDKVNDAVYKEVVSQVNAAAKQQVTEKVEAVVKEQVRAQVEAGANQLVHQKVEAAVRAQVEAKVTPVVREEVKTQVTAAVRGQVEIAVRNPSDSDIENQLQSSDVQAQINAAVDEYMNSDEGKNTVETQLKAIVTEKVTAAYREQVRSQVEASYREQVKTEVTKQVRAEVEAQIRANASSSDNNDNNEGENKTEQSAFLRFLFPAAFAEDNTSEDDIQAQVDAMMQTEKIQSEITSRVNAQVSSSEGQAQIESLTDSQMASSQSQIDALIAQNMQDSATRSQVESGVRAKAKETATAKAKQQIIDKLSSLSESEISAMVDSKMASADIQALIESNTDSQMNGTSTKQAISDNVDAQMKTDSIQATIEQEYQNQLASDSVKQTVEDEINNQMQSEKVQTIISQNIAEQMNSDSVKALISQNITEQMNSSKVKKIISEQIELNRHGKEYMDSVAQALEENGEDGAAYRSLVDLHDSLDSVSEFYQGLQDYTDAVGTAAEGAGTLLDGMSELKDGLDTLNTKLVIRLTDFLDTDAPEIRDRLQCVIDMSKAYNSYAGISEDMTGSVHFLIRTAGVTANSEA